MQALWLYIKHNQLQDGHEREYINCNRYFRQVSCRYLPLVLSTQPLAHLLWNPSAQSSLRVGLPRPSGLTCFGCSFQIFSCGRLRFSEIPMKLAGLLQHPDPIVINHVIR